MPSEHLLVGKCGVWLQRPVRFEENSCPHVVTARGQRFDETAQGLFDHARVILCQAKSQAGQKVVDGLARLSLIKRQGAEEPR